MINVVLFQPEKPLNAGNIFRTCMALNCRLHIIGPLTFKMDEKGFKRAGMDYIKNTDYHYYDDYEEFLSKNNDPEVIFITRYGDKTPDSIDFKDTKKEYYVMFGKESTGIPKYILKSNLDNCYRIPMNEEARSLNLSNCVAILVYEIIRQQGYNGLSKTEVIKGKDFLINYEGDD